MQGLRIESLVFFDRGPYNLTVNPGQCVCITGASGSGKSLLLRSIADLDSHQGKVFLNDIEVNDLPAPEWRKQVGMLPAESRWWLDLVGDHFSGNRETLLHQLGFEPDILTWQVKRLSTGERQRLAIARLLSQEPKALLLDEPTASLDSENVSRVENMIRQYLDTNNVPALWISHDLQQVRRVADKHIVLKNSHLSEKTDNLI